MRSPDPRDTAEKLVYLKLKRTLSESFEVWNNFQLPYREDSKRDFIDKENDFLVVHPEYGFFFIEVKSFIIDNFEKIDASNWHGNFHHNSQIANPFLVLKHKKDSFSDYIRKKAPSLFNVKGEYLGKLKVPINCAVFLPNISRIKWEEKGYDSKINLVFEDDLQNAVVDSELDELLIGTREHSFQPKSSLTESDLRTILDILGNNSIVKSPSNRTIGRLDPVQEKLSNFTFKGVTLIEGPAGSGKTIILVKRAQNYLKHNPNHKIGVFASNNTMVAYLKTLIKSDHIVVSTLSKCAKDFGIGQMNEGVFTLNSDHSSINQASKFDALFIDEGQDLKEQDFAFTKSIVKKSDSEITIVYDKRQIIYSGGNSDSFISKPELINSAVEREIIKQHRSGFVELATLYYDWASLDFLSDIDSVHKALTPLFERMFNDLVKVSKKAIMFIESGVNSFTGFISGKKKSSEMIKSIDFEMFSGEEAEKLMINRAILDIVTRLGSTRAFEDYIIILPWVSDKNLTFLQEGFKRYYIPFEIFHKSKGCRGAFNSKGIINMEYEQENNLERLDFSSSHIKVFPIHHVKGFEAEHVYLLNFQLFPYFAQKPDILPAMKELYHGKSRLISLIYVAITRAKKTLRIYSSREEVYFNKLKVAADFLST